MGHDPDSTVARRYGVVGYPVSIVVDERGVKRWKAGPGVHGADEIVAAVESVL